MGRRGTRVGSINNQQSAIVAPTGRHSFREEVPSTKLLGSSAEEPAKRDPQGGTALRAQSAVNQAPGKERGRSRERVTRRAPRLPGGSGVKLESERLLGSDRPA
jgi:hypothetical protein